MMKGIAALTGKNRFLSMVVFGGVSFCFFGQACSGGFRSLTSTGITSSESTTAPSPPNNVGVTPTATPNSAPTIPTINSVQGFVMATDSSIFYSPGNWGTVNSNQRKSVNAGAYFRTIFSGSVCSLQFDASQNGSPLSEVYVSVDSGIPVKSIITSSIDCTPVTTQTEHTLEFSIKSTSQYLYRWNPSQTAIVFQGLQLSIGAYTREPTHSTCQGVIFGDSITEGILTTPGAGGENDQGDATLGWAFLQKTNLGCEIGVVGFGYQGFTHDGNGYVPAFGDSWPLVLYGVNRDFTNVTFIMVNQGTNDGAADATSLESTFLTGILAATNNSAPIFILRPFNGSQSTNWQSSIASVASPRLHFIDTTGFFDVSESADGVHPNATADVTIATLISAQIRPLLAP